MKEQYDDHGEKTKVHLIVRFVTKATETEWQREALHGVQLLLHQNTCEAQRGNGSFFIAYSRSKMERMTVC